MRNGRMLARWRTAVLAVAAVLGLAACERDSTGADPAPLGTWAATLQTADGRIVHRLQITPTLYVWEEETYGAGGRPEDGLRQRFVHRGDWRVRGDRLALRAGGMTLWTHPSGEQIVDFVVQWDNGNRVSSLEGDRMTLTHEPPPETSYRRPTLDFERMREID
jgi:hypothetical protein